MLFSPVLFSTLKTESYWETNNTTFFFSIETKEEPQNAEKEKESLPFEDPVCITLEYFR